MEFTFTLRYQLSEEDMDQEALVERLLGGGCDDALIGIGRPGRIVLDFDREAESAKDAMFSALQDIQRIMPSATLIEAMPDLVGLTDIADAVGITRQGARKLMSTNAAGFPTPVHDGSTALWHLADVLHWMEGRRAYDVANEMLEVSQVAKQINLMRLSSQIDPSLKAESHLVSRKLATRSPETPRRSLAEELASFKTFAPTQSDRVLEQYTTELLHVISRAAAPGRARRNIEDRFAAGIRRRDKSLFLSTACELTALDHFQNVFAEDFQAYVHIQAGRRPVTAGAKNCDFAFSVDGVTFLVEVKSLAFDHKDKNPSPIKSFLPPEQTHALYTLVQAQAERQGEERRTVFSKNCAPAISRLLDKANMQLDGLAEGFRVVLLCCNDFDQYADALTCFVGPHGLLNQTEKLGVVLSATELPNIDAVVLCSLGLPHAAVLQPELVLRTFGQANVSVLDGAAAWRFESSLQVGIHMRQLKWSTSILRTFTSAFALRRQFDRSIRHDEGDLHQQIFDFINEALPSTSLPQMLSSPDARMAPS